MPIIGTKDYRIPPTDRRLMRAKSLAHAILSAVFDRELYFSHNDELEIYRAVVDRLCDLGVDVITDEDRKRAGLPPRDERGYTQDELHAIEAMRLQIMRTPLVEHPTGIEPV